MSLEQSVNQQETRGSSIFNKILLSFFLLILFIGISINYFLQKYLQAVLNGYSVDTELIRSIMTSFIKMGAGVTLLFTFLSILISYFIARSLIRPIRELKNAADEIKKGNLNHRIELISDDETGELAREFNQMAANLQELKIRSEVHSNELEKVVTRKTNELQAALDKMNIDKKELEDQRSAILNILEDVQESQEELEASKQDLETRHSQLETIKTLSDKLTSVMEVREACALVYEHLKNITKSSVVTILISNPFEEGDLYFKSFLGESVNERYVNYVKEEIVEYIATNKKRFSNNNNKILDKICPSLDGEKIDNLKTCIPSKSLLIPLGAADNFYGLIHLSYCSSMMSGQEAEENLARAIGATLSVTISRLHALDRSQHSKTESLIRSLSDGVIMFTKDRNIVLTNSRATAYTGLLFTSATLDDFLKLFPDIKLGDMIDGAIRKGVVSHINEILLVNKFYEINISPVKDSEGDIVGGSIIIHDISYMKEIDRMKTEFVSVASHQLRTPLTAVKLFTEVLTNEDIGKLNDEQKEYLQNIYNSTSRMVILVNDLLNVTRIESGKLRISPIATDINEFIDNLIIEAKPTADIKGVKIMFLKNKMKKVMIDQNLFRQVIQNLLSNSIRYAKLKKGRVNIKISNDENYYYISIRDNGIGIPKEMQSRIFEKFYRADNAIKVVTEGTGLGLYTSKMIVETSGGRIWFESNEKSGTIFNIKMPLVGMEKREGERGLMIS